MGGTGKTPFTTFLADMFIREGRKTAILSRGYKGALGYATHIISDGSTIYHTPPEAADEPYMMAVSVPGVIVITGKDRNKSYNLAVEKFKPSVFILDDGFQHRKMRRDLDIVLLDYTKPLSTGFPFPFGYLREFPSALKRAGIIVFTRATGTEIPPKAAKYCAGKPVYFSEFVYSKFISDNAELAPEALNGKNVWLMSGIAGNNQFGSQILKYAVKVSGHTKFGDHHAYSSDELEKVIKHAKEAGAELIITTQKDFVKIPEAYAPHFIYPVMGINILNQGQTGSFFDEVKKRM